MKIYKINADTDFSTLCKLISPEKMGQKIMSEKTKIHFFYIKDISAPAANILKQDALRVGAELVTHKEVITGRVEHSNALLMATKEQISRLVAKEKKQDFKLKDLANFLEAHFKKPEKPELMAVLNVNEDSFNAASRVSAKDFETRLNALLELEPEYIDIGAVSSRPGSTYAGSTEEYRRLEKIFEILSKNNYTSRTKFSLDSFDERCLKAALDIGFKMINDITGLKNKALARLAKEYDAEYCLMHMQNSPENMQDAPFYEDLLGEIDAFFKERLEILEAEGVKKVFLDVGIGFGKTPYHNLLLIKHLEHFLHFKKPLLVGASRKSLVNAYFQSEIKDRLAGTLYFHLKAYENGAKVLRVHDLYEHKQLFAMHEALQGAGF